LTLKVLDRDRIAALHVAARDLGFHLRQIDRALRSATTAYRTMIESGWHPPVELGVRCALELANDGQLSLSTVRELERLEIALPDLPPRSQAAVDRARRKLWRVSR